MKTSLECMECNIKQLIKVSKYVDASTEKQQEAARVVFDLLSSIDFEQTNPEIMGKTWKVLQNIFGESNPYKEAKIYYNELLLEIYSQIEAIIEKSKEPLNTALKIAVVGNLIDFGARHKFDREEILHRISNYQEIEFKIDATKELLQSLKEAKLLFYIGDNCGEIVLDKLFISEIKKVNPNISVYFGVRGGPILNDVTVEDYHQVNMKEVAKMISSQNAVPGTVLKDSSESFNSLYEMADIVIAKGQGNYESLSDHKRNNLYLLFMAKCQYVADNLNVNMKDYICIHNK